MQGDAGSLFSDSEPVASRAVRVLTVDAPALVLGSTQRLASPPSSLEVVRRRSGGGAVLLRPGETVWVDVVVPAGDRLWEDDIGRSFWWLGEAWLRALSALGAGPLAVHRDGLVSTAWSSAVCFAGVGAGEVVRVGAGAKVVGMASRRTRAGALFQCAVPLVWDPVAYVALLGLPPSALDELAGVAAPLTGADPEAVVAAFLAALPPD
jgi:lipoate-protein ligase A